MAESRTFDAGLFCLSRRLTQGAIAHMVLQTRRIGSAEGCERSAG